MHLFKRRKMVLINKPISILLFTNSLVILAGAMLGPIYALFVADIGGDLLDASLAGGAFALAAGITTFISGKYADSVKENELIVALGYTLLAVGFGAYFFAESIIAILAIQILIGFAEAIYSPAFDAIYSKHLPENHGGTAWGAWEAMNYLVSAVGAVVGGYIVTKFGFSPIFGVMSGLCLASAVYIYFLPRKAL